MTDVYDRGKRSERSCVAYGRVAVAGRQNYALMRLFQELRIAGWRRHLRLPGRPDFCFTAKRLAIFVDGDFWHGNPYAFRLLNRMWNFGTEKIKGKIVGGDRRNTRALRERGWTVIRIWESELRTNQIRVLRRIASRL